MTANAQPITITIIGAGSGQFTAELLTDFLCTPGLDRGTFNLVDIDDERLELSKRIGEHLIERSGRDWNIVATTDRTEVLAGSKYVINTIEVAGLENVRHDYDIPMRYGVDQCIGDTIGPGGLFKSLRTLPVWLDIVRDIERLAPDAIVMNYTNPMSVTVLTALRATKLNLVGLCHAVFHTVQTLGEYLEIPPQEIEFNAGGVNHLSWITELTHDGVDLFPLLHEVGRKPEIYDQDPVRFEILFEMGAFAAESSGHNSEYTQWFRKRPDLVETYARSGYRGESGFYANNWPTWRAEADDRLRRVLAGEEEIELERGGEYASYLVEAVESGQPASIFVNVMNNGLIDNLPATGAVEVAATVDSDGVHATPFGSLASHLAAPVMAHMCFHDLVARSVLDEDREAAVHALMVDPLTSAVCSLGEIRAMFDEMVDAQREYLPEYLSHV